MDEKYGFLPLHERQIALERQMRGLGFDREKSGVQEAREQERESETSYGHKLLLSVVDPLSESITAYVEEAFSGMAGRHQRAAVRVRHMNHDAVAYLAAKTALDSLTINKLEQTVAHEIGRAIEEEARFSTYQEKSPALMDTIKRDHKKRGKNTRFTKQVLKLRLAKAGVEWEEWPERECILLGYKMIELLLAQEQPIIARDRMRVRKQRKFKPGFRLVPGPGVTQMIADSRELNALFTPGLLPTVVPPKHWTGPYNGAYWTGAVDKRARRLVKTRNMNYMDELRAVEMPDVYAAINAVQGTAWQINTRVLDVMHEAWSTQVAVGSLPKDAHEEEPSKPVIVPPCKCYCDDKKLWGKTPAGMAWRAWRKMAHTTHEYNAKTKSKRLQAAKVLWVADMMKDDPKIYFPHQLDFRSRVYAMPMFLHPQGPDYVRGLIRFATGKPINNQTAAHWLAVHGANSYGIDKVSFHERVDWVRTNHERILSAAFDPMGTVKWWGEAENPWQFLAFCFEWAEFQKVGVLVSHLPVSLDGTCNGLQHFSAMLRDPVGGAAVNLTPNDKPQDIYAEVAKKVNEKLRMALVMPPFEHREMAAQWLAFGVDRKLCKRPVMILPYGGTQYACRQYVEEFVLDLIMNKRIDNPFGDNLMDAVVYLTELIWAAIGETVVAAKDAMQWLRKTASLMAKAKLPIIWQTPAGFPVRQAYPEMRHAIVEFLVDGVRKRRRVDEVIDGLNPDEQINGLSPNFVHSLDAAALMESVLRVKDQGVRSFAMVHDSYGTHAADTEALTTALRAAFVDMYKGRNVLADLRTAVITALPKGAVPEIPKMGSLNIDAVLDSKFFFA